MACLTHAHQIDLRFGDSASAFKDFGGGFLARYFVRQCFYFNGQAGVRMDGYAQSMATRVS